MSDIDKSELREKVEEAMTTILQKDLFVRKGAYIAQSETVDRVMQLITQQCNQARMNQIERDFTKIDLCTDIDEAVLFDIRKSQEEQVNG